MKIKINEIYKSIQGESSYSGIPCTFIRFTFCNLRCSYCDTEYAFYDGNDMTIDEIINKVDKLNCHLVEITGGEPLLQPGYIKLIEKLENNNYKVLVETGGALSIKEISKKTHIILDLKCPSSNMEDRNLFENLKYLKKTDEVKFVIGNKEDYKWTKSIIEKHELNKKCSILISPVYNRINPKEIVDWILEDNLDVRFQLQIHKEIWDEKTKGV